MSTTSDIAPRKRFIAWARVSSQRQKDEGWSLEYQEQKLAEYAARNGGEVVKLYVVAETASKHQERRTFQEMLSFAREHARQLDGLLVMKIDRAARNMRDFVVLESLEEDHGVRLISVTQPTENTPAGRMMRRTFATFAAYFTDQLSVDVKQAMRRRAEAGLFVTLAPYGYRNVRAGDGRRRVVEVDPAEAANVRLIFDLYAYHNHTLDSLLEHLRAAGIAYTRARAGFTRSKLYELLTDRSYVGEVDHLGQWHAGSHEPLVDRPTFDRVQELLGRRTYRSHDHLYGAQLITCGHCGRPVCGERAVRRRGGTVREYCYYRCARYNVPGHPRVRLTEAEIDRQVLGHFDRLRIADDDVREWFACVFRAKTRGLMEARREQRERLSAELTRVRNQKDALLNLRLAGEVDADTYAAKSRELRDREAHLQVEIDGAGREQSEQAETAIRAFELSQSLREKWLTSEHDAKRRILEILCLNCHLDGASLVLEMRNPFGVLAEGVLYASSAQDRI